MAKLVQIGTTDECRSNTRLHGHRCSATPFADSAITNAQAGRWLAAFAEPAKVASLVDDLGVPDLTEAGLAILSRFF